MVDKKQIEESSRIIIQLIKDGKIISPKPNTDEFFLKRSNNALTISKRLYDLFEEEQLDTHSWVVNTSYYSMFFAATALLARYNHKIDVETGIHKLTYHALVHYFILKSGFNTTRSWRVDFKRQKILVAKSKKF